MFPFYPNNCGVTNSGIPSAEKEVQLFGDITPSHTQPSSRQSKKAESDVCSLFPLIHDIIKGMDKDSQDVHQELAKLKSRIHDARDQIGAMPGIHTSPWEQQQELETLRVHVCMNYQLLQKYKGLCMFEVPKAS
ncbi:hypothetical protein DPEC_G00308950 [Dallia pectoralis]|uniref:Uncharacterized protein n=1 Tax=Dallia pectoralis TaxID=75939 RepID=A0ACC2FET1_DALPE|nr:hypothetical protein DPEC_G00308950 [Dallia pectoralis]